MLHPSVILLLWLIAGALIQTMPVFLVAIIAATTASISGATLRQHTWRLLAKTRWLLLALISTYLLMTPGERVMVGVPVTMEGLEQGTSQAVRLLATVYAVAVLMVLLPPNRFLTATWVLSGGARWDAVRKALTRLALVLDESGQLVRNKMNWRQLLRSGGGAPRCEIEKSILVLVVEPVPLWQWGLVAFVSTGGVFAMVLWGR